MTHLFDLAVISVALALLCAAIMTAIAELLGRKNHAGDSSSSRSAGSAFGLQLPGRPSS
jgi:hypothetical protein